MRALTDAPRLRLLMQALGRAATAPADVFFKGGASAVLVGWRESTLDADLRVVPDGEWLFRAIPTIKEELQINIEFASPSDFIPELPGWRDRCVFVDRVERVGFFHSQALAKIERGHALDRHDVAEMLARGLVTREKLRALYDTIEPALGRYPALDAPSFRRQVWDATC